MKFRFFTNISHELRTPLTLIITPLDMLKRKITDESVSRQLSNIYRNAQELLNLVNQLLDFRKLEMKGEKLLLMNGDLEEFLESIYNSFHPVAVEKHLDFTCRMPHQVKLNGLQSAS
jgi:signal transduction histidine kinase